MASILEQDIKYLKGVGPARAKILGEELRVFTVRDLLFCFPAKHIDRSEILHVRDLTEDLPYVQLKGQIVDMTEEGTRGKRRLRAVFTDGTGYVELVWFSAVKRLRETLKVRKTYLLLGKPGVFGGHISITHPELDNAENGAELKKLGLQPVYSLSDKLKKNGFTSRVMNTLLRNAFDAIAGKPIDETLPTYIIAREGLMPLGEALQTLHFPTSAETIPLALHRVKFEELFYLQLDILRYAKNRKLKLQGFTFTKVGPLFHEFYNHHLPFSLTEAQKRVVKEIWKDLGSGRQMNRLLQGDVGSGKTMVALMACLLAIGNGFQACIMAPTEILAEQHMATISALLEGMPLRTALLTGIVKGKARREVLQGVADGSINILVGTHALIEPNVMFLNLGLCVIDEQHRFGVKQRAKLWQKNSRPPHILVMTATPIPRTLAMTVYGDLDVSVIDELPPGRKPVKTLHYYEDTTVKLFEGVRYQLRLGRQVYFVFPLIEESEKLDLQNLEEGFGHICKAFSEYKVGKVHGRMKPAEKEEAMRAFLAQETQILVSTTVIEVGVNVPNASVMVIENAERFGLAQLHQLRGRVGRGADQSYCILVTKRELSNDTRRRMNIMVETTDGFRIAEEDMKLRGPGDLEGTQQSGMPFDLHVADILRDSALMEKARGVASDVLERDPYEQQPENAVLWRELQRLKKEKTNFSSIS
ncbi:MAG: ATP-dependent DNA helicase RecG [Alloprevotella sp.]|nr:ATP-dependent DNA helicase RecG [Alloprevotella sp.]MBR1653043.1 ATP-dependent DNA helicase RecG [Alloprevotella sp.]MBR1653278.1 ATP-dependent DNA helicase RecG [Alloprevotella sp.]